MNSRKRFGCAVNHQAPEDVAFDKQDRIYTGADDGYIYRLQPDGTGPEVFTRTYGRPLGLAFDQNWEFDRG